MSSWPKIVYMAGYKYQLIKSVEVDAGIFPAFAINTKFLSLDLQGILTIKAGYAWDGPSGPTIDTKSTMRAGLAHDALYQLIRNDKISQSRRGDVDRFFRCVLREDGMWKPRAWYYYQAVRKFALSASSAENRKKVHEAP